MTKRKLIYGCLIVVMCLGLTGCKSTDYKDAVEFQNTKDYSSAVTLYEELGDYKDSSSRLADCKAMISAIDGYNKAKALTDEKNTELDTAISAAEALISKGDKALDETLITTLETAVSATKAVKFSLPDMPVTAKEIEVVTDDMNKIDYSSTLSNLSTNKQNLENSIKQYALVDAPEESYIITCLSNVPNIVDISAVTEDNDPNGNLNKAGGYTAQVYFSSDLVDQSDVSGSTVIEKGTDCGGSIEVYATPEEAKTRNEYLGSFDGSIFASGSHTVVGTVLVRTSDKLTASQQKGMESNIIAALTTIE